MSSDNSDQKRKFADQMAQQNAYVNQFYSFASMGDTQSGTKYFGSLTAPKVAFDTYGPGGVKTTKNDLQANLDNLAKAYMTRANEIRQRLLFPGRDSTIVAGNQDMRNDIYGGYSVLGQGGPNA